MSTACPVHAAGFQPQRQTATLTKAQKGMCSEVHSGHPRMTAILPSASLKEHANSSHQGPECTRPVWQWSSNPCTRRMWDPHVRK
jgi:hypothetical protein